MTARRTTGSLLEDSGVTALGKNALRSEGTNYVDTEKGS
jgi:hypothetical protein